MTGEQFEAAWRLAREPLSAGVVGVWAMLGVLVVAFIVRFRTDWREGVKAGAALVAATVALAFSSLERGQSRLNFTTSSRSSRTRKSCVAGASRFAATSPAGRSNADKAPIPTASKSRVCSRKRMKYLKPTTRARSPTRSGRGSSVVVPKLGADGAHDAIRRSSKAAPSVIVSSCGYSRPIVRPVSPGAWTPLAAC